MNDSDAALQQLVKDIADRHARLCMHRTVLLQAVEKALPLLPYGTPEREAVKAALALVSQ